MEEQTKTKLDEQKDGELIKQWEKEAKEMTIGSLPSFIEKLTTHYEHDYGTVCRAIACVAIASANATMRTPACDGITGFQAGCIQWDMIRLWGIFNSVTGLKIIDHDELLYPHNEAEFRTISRNVWVKVQKEARDKLKYNPNANPSVIKHWNTIVDGKIPFGLTLESEGKDA